MKPLPISPNKVLSLLFSSLLPACGMIGIPRDQIRNIPIIVHPNHEWLFPTQYLYENVEQNRLEERLVELAGSEEVEESWVYNIRTRELRETGHYETKDSVNAMNPFWFPYFAQGGDTVIFYHLHLINSHFFSPSKTVTNAQIIERLNTSNQVIALPSGNDIKGAIDFLDYYKNNFITFESRIADYEGVLAFTFTVSSNLDQLPPKVNELQVRYKKFEIGFEKYKTEMQILGVSVEYRKVRDMVFREEDVTIHRKDQ